MENKYTDQATSDQAWDMMHATLDKEMPLEKKRRAIWWLPLIFGLLAFGAWYLFEHNQVEDQFYNNGVPTKNENLIIANTNNQNPISEEKKVIANEITQNPIDKIVNEPSKNIKQTEKTTALAKTRKTAVVSSKSTESVDLRSKLNSQWTTPAAKQKVVIATPLNSKFNNGFAQAVPQNLKESSVKTPSEKLDNIAKVDKLEMAKANLANAEQNKEIIMQALPSLPLLSLESEEIPAVFEPVKQKNNKWSFAIQSTFFTDIKYNSEALLLEGVVFRKLSDRWTLKSGLGFKAESRPFFFRFGPQLESDFEIGIMDIDPVGNSNAADLTLSESYAIFGTRSYEYLYIPIGVEYRLKNRWVLSAGLNYNFINLDSIFNADFGDLPNNNHFSLNVGVSYLLSSRLSIGIQAQRNTSRSIFDSDRLEAGRNQLGVSMRYQF